MEAAAEIVGFIERECATEVRVRRGVDGGTASGIGRIGGRSGSGGGSGGGGGS